jgi:hypothetical protein
MDSLAAVRNLINGGGPVKELNDLMKEWFDWCTTNNIVCTYEWIPREENKSADGLSKLIANTDWILKDEIKRQLNIKYGPLWMDEKMSDMNHNDILLCANGIKCWTSDCMGA